MRKLAESRALPLLKRPGAAISGYALREECASKEGAGMDGARPIHRQPRRRGVSSSRCSLSASAGGKMLSYLARASRIKRARSSSALGTNRMTSPMCCSKIG